jgi:hypothetical protein
MESVDRSDISDISDSSDDLDGLNFLFEGALVVSLFLVVSSISISIDKSSLGSI